MQVSPAMGSFDDFLNLDMDNSTTSTQQDLHDLFSPRLSDGASPSSATTFLPPNTPPQQPMQPQTALDTLNPNNLVFNELYRTYIEPLKAGNDFAAAAGPSSAVGEGAFAFNDLFASYSDSLFQPIATAAGSAQSLPFPFTIDPQLVATPAPTTTATPVQSPIIDAAPTKPPPKASASKAAVPRASTVSVVDDEDDDDDDDDEEDDEDLAPLRGKGGAKGRKVGGGVAAGGIVKRTGATSCVVRDADSNDPEDWRPTPEEYKKLSSKEKRQLRNKISARNFRVRRKEYITTLEGQISDRDKLIAAIRDELGAQKLENAELRQEIDNLKKVMLGAPPPTGLPPPNTHTNISVSTPSTTTRRSAQQLAKANPNKDVAAAGSGSFWGGAMGAGMGGITPVHAAIIPDITFPNAVSAPSVASVLGGKNALNGGRWIPMSTASLGTLPGYASRQDNINPNLNNVTSLRPSSTTSSSPLSGLESMASPSSSSSESGGPGTPSPPQSPPSLALVGFNQQQMQQWNGLGDINPFTIKTLDSYRLQLWGKMAAAGQLPGFAPSLQQQQQQLGGYQQQQSNSLAGQLRPAFFTTPTTEAKASTGPAKSSSSATLSAILAGKAVSSLSSNTTNSASAAYPSPPTSPAAKPTTLSTPVAGTPQQIQYAAALASQSLVSRMGSAFWDAFSGSSSSSSPASSSTKSWDMDKVRKVLEGKAVLKVVDVDSPAPESPKAGSAAVGLGLEEKMRSLSLSTGMSGADREVEAPAYKPGLLKHLLK